MLLSFQSEEITSLVPTHACACEWSEGGTINICYIGMNSSKRSPLSCKVVVYPHQSQLSYYTEHQRCVRIYAQNILLILDIGY